VLVEPMAWFTGRQAPVHFPGVPFLIAALIAIASLVVLQGLQRLTPRPGIEY
jgi:DHA1 family tetracycline resistance protein-like MFS transporter